MQYHKDISLYIKKRRQEKDISLNDFALDNELEPATLCRYENGKRGISLANLVKIAKGFGLTPSEFLAEFEKECIKNE